MIIPREKLIEAALLRSMKQLLREIRKMNRKNREIFDDEDDDGQD